MKGEKRSESAASKRARKFRRCRRRKAAEKAAGQASVIVNDDAPMSRAGAI
jgi:hypothetical protein